jgi:hypoxanthine phosphoribosyltransferase
MDTVRLHDKEFEPFISEGDVAAAVDRLAAELRIKYEGKRPLFLGVLNGAFFFAAELLKRLPIECEISFVKVASYHGTRSTGTVSQLIGLNEKIEGRHVVVLEDIVDTGHTIRHIMDILAERHPASVSIATLLFKPDAYKEDVPIEHVALRIPNDFVVGSGLDHDGLGRNLPGIYTIVEG